MVFITPRSFCSGLYYKKFREWLVKNVRIENIHIFESRKEVFDKDGVLQESVILKATKCEPRSQAIITISVSRNRDLTKTRRMKVRYSSVVNRKNGETFIRIPT